MFKKRRFLSAMLILGMIFGSLTKAPVAYAEESMAVETVAAETASSVEEIAKEILESTTEVTTAGVTEYVEPTKQETAAETAEVPTSPEKEEEVTEAPETQAPVTVDTSEDTVKETAEPDTKAEEPAVDEKEDVTEPEETQAEVPEDTQAEEPEDTKAEDPEETQAEEPEEPSTEEPVAEKVVYSKVMKEVIVSVSVDKTAFEEEVELVVAPIEADTEEYKDAEKALTDEGKVFDGMMAFDIGFQSVATGEKVEPNGTVAVTMMVNKAALSDIDAATIDADSMTVSHITENAVEDVADVADETDGQVTVNADDTTVKSVKAEFDVEGFSTFTLTWKNGENTESATIHFVELDENGIPNELSPSVSLDSSAASVSLSTDFPDVEGKEYRFVGGYYSAAATTNPADATAITATLTKNANGTWSVKPEEGEDFTIANGSHIYATYKQFTKAGNTPSTGDASLIKPDSIKNVTDNGDGTYTVRLDINGHQHQEKQGANVLLIFDRTSSMVDNNMGSVTRFAAAKSAVHTLVEALDPANNPITMSVMSFARNADANYVNWTRTGSSITSFTDGLQAAPNGSTPGGGGTNWEAAFVMAKDILDDAPGSNPTYVVFLTDGNPTIYVGSNTIRNATATSAEYTRARTEAAGINSAIPIYGILCANEADGPLLNTLMTQLATATYGSHETHYVLANNETTLTSTFREIGNKILADLGASQASTNDGVTALSTTSATAGAAGAFKYYKTPRPAGMADDAIIPEADLVPWSGAPAASYSAATGVTWDLESVGVLEDNTSYTLEFTVWPSQAAYDLIADLNNGLKSYDSLDAATKAQVYESGGKYYLRTNTNFDTSYAFQNEQYTDPGTTQSEGRMVLPTETIDIEKIWNNILDQRTPPKQAVLVLTKDGDDYLAGDDAITVSATTGWKAEVFISLGQILQNNTDKTYEVLETGHDYEIIEPPELNQYQWELHSEVFRPMVINGSVVMLIKDNNVTGTDGVDYYEIGGNKYKPATGSNNLRAWNDRRSWLQVEKSVEETTPAAPADTLFEYTITVTNANASQGKESDTASDYYVWFSAFENGSAVKDLEVSDNVQAETNSSGKTGYFYVKSGEQFTVKIQAGWTLRFLNLPSGSTYSIQETNLPDGFTFVSAADRQVVDTEADQDAPQKPTISNETVTGTINVPNVEFYVDYTNKYEETSITVTKKWEDNNDQDGIRVAAEDFDGNISLLVNGTASTKYTPAITDKGDGTYTITYTGLPKYVNGTAATYTVEETTVPPGYTVSPEDPVADGGTITNSYEPETTEVVVEKTWVNADGSTTWPTGVTVTVQLTADGEAVSGKTATLTASQTSYTFTDLPKNNAGEEIEYGVEEVEVAGYDSEVGDLTDGKITITNTQETTEVEVEKVWKNADGSTTWPNGVTVEVQLTADGTAVSGKTTTLSATKTSDKFTSLPKYQADGTTEIAYSVEEVEVAGYDSEVGDLTNGKITITNTQETTEVEVEKVWKNADGSTTWPTGVTVEVQLTADGTAVSGKTTTLSAGKTSDKFTSLPKYKADGETEIAYSVEEVEVAGYDSEVGDLTDGKITITNTQVPTTANAKKAWKNADGTTTAPANATVEFTLYADGTATTYKVTLDGTADTEPTGTAGYESAAWTATFVNLPMYKAGTTTEIVYTVAETGTYPGYTASTTDPVASGETITNTQVPTTANAKKAWKNADGTTTAPQGATVVFTLYADGTAMDYTVTLDGTADTAPTGAGGYESEAWTATFVNLPMYKAGTTTAIEYTVAETAAYPGYTASTTDPVASGETITNTQVPTTANAKKAWKNADGTTTAPANATVEFTLYADGTAMDYTVTLDGTADTAPTGAGGYESEAWTASFVNLPMYKAGTTTAIEYTVAETGTYPGYTASTTDPVASGGTITNTQEKTTADATKAWKNADGTTTAPANATVEFTLYADGTATTYKVTLDGTADTEPTGTAGYESEAWTATFVNLPMYKVGTTTEIEYTVAETTTYPGYTASTTDPVASGETITNTQGSTETFAIKAWKNADGTTTAPQDATVVFTLYADGTALTYTVTLDGTVDSAPEGTGGYESEAWKATFVNLPKYKIGTTTEIVYTIAETTTYPGYTASTTTPVGSGSTITNTQVPTTANAKKAWVNADGTTTPPQGATVVFTLYADGTATNYTVTLKGSADTAPTVTGGYESEAWTATFVNLPKYQAGTTTEIEYTVKETTTYGGYTASPTDPVASGETITNTQEKTTADATKAWVNADGTTTPPEGATVVFTLYADGEPTDYTVTLDGTADTEPTGTAGYESEAWKATFVNLPKYQPGTTTEIVYTVAETTTYPGYTMSPDDPVASGETITNTQEKIDVEATKAWKNADETTTAPEGATVVFTLYADGTATEYTVTLDGTVDSSAEGTAGYESEAWKAAFVNLPKYKIGTTTEIVYTVAETTTYPGYTMSPEDPVASGETITNTQITTEVKVEKNWVNADGSKTWPDGVEVEVQLLANDEPVDGKTVVLSTEKISHTFESLPKYKVGTTTEIKYSVEENMQTVPAGYVKDISGDAEKGFTITNTFSPEYTDPPVTKTTTGDTPVKEATFTFKLKAVSTTAEGLEGKMPMPEATNGAQEMLMDVTIPKCDGIPQEFGEFMFTVPGNYVYEISEEKTTEEGYVIDTKVYTLEYNIGVDGETNALTKEMSVNGKVVEEFEQDTILFTNTYTMPKVELEVIKVWDDSDDMYSTRPASITIELLADGKKVDGAEAVMTEMDGWTYTFEELDKYDENGNEIKYSVAEPEVEGYTGEVGEVTGDAENGYAVTITNTLNEMIPAKKVVTVKKVVEGNPEKPETFEFTLKAAGSAPMPAGAKNGKLTIKGSGSSQLKFTFEDPGTYTYVLKEVNNGAKNYTYDKAEYKLVFKVTVKDGSNKLEAKLTVTKSGSSLSGTTCTFTNKFADIPVTGDDTNNAPWIAAMATSAAAAGAGLVIYKKRRKEEGEDA